MGFKKYLSLSSFAVLVVLSWRWLISEPCLSTFSVNSEQMAVEEEQKVTTFFSTACSANQDWQSQVVVYNHYQMGIPGDLVRLMACDDRNYTLPNHTMHPNYRVVWTPDFDQQEINLGHVAYSPRNKPGSLEYWLSGRSEDQQYPRGDRHIVLGIDPDQVFLTGHIDLSRVRPRHGLAASYSLGTRFLEEWGHVCGLHNEKDHNGYSLNVESDKKNGTWSNQTKCQLWQEHQSNPSYGFPQVLTASDALEHSSVWYHLTNELKVQGHGGWETEMFSSVFAALVVGIHFEVSPFMVSNPDDSNNEPWKDILGSVPLLRETTLATLPMLIGHYCQEYYIGNFSWYKYSEDSRYSIHSCQEDPQDFFVKSPDADHYQLMEKARRFHRAHSGMDPSERELEFRRVWMLDHVWTKVKEALVAHYEAFCGS